MLKIPSIELNTVSKLELEKRYTYFIKRIADQQEVCILRNSDDTFFVDQVNSKSILHMWSGVEFAHLFLEYRNLQLNTSIIDFDVLSKNIYPLISENNAIISIMPVFEPIGFDVSIARFNEDLYNYIDEWYS